MTEIKCLKDSETKKYIIPTNDKTHKKHDNKYIIIDVPII